MDGSEQNILAFTITWRVILLLYCSCSSPRWTSWPKYFRNRVCVFNCCWTCSMFGQESFNCTSTFLVSYTFLSANRQMYRRYARAHGHMRWLVAVKMRQKMCKSCKINNVPNITPIVSIVIITMFLHVSPFTTISCQKICKIIEKIKSFKYGIISHFYLIFRLPWRKG